MLRARGIDRDRPSVEQDGQIIAVRADQRRACGGFPRTRCRDRGVDVFLHRSGAGNLRQARRAQRGLVLQG